MLHIVNTFLAKFIMVDEYLPRIIVFAPANRATGQERLFDLSSQRHVDIVDSRFLYNHAHVFDKDVYGRGRRFDEAVKHVASSMTHHPGISRASKHNLPEEAQWELQSRG